MDVLLQQISDLCPQVDAKLTALQTANGGLQKDNDQLTESNKALGAQILGLESSLDAANAKSAARTSKILLPGNFHIWQNLEMLPMATNLNSPPIGTWGQPGNSGNTGGSSTATHGTFIHTPSSFTEKPAKAYDNYYYFTNLGAFPLVTDFSWSADLTFPALTDENASQAIEWELEQCVAGFAYNMGWQALFGSKEWRTFDFVNRAWVAVPGIPLTQFSPGAPVKLTAEYHIDYAANAVTHVALNINGVRYPVGTTRPGKQRWSATANYLHYAFQTDTDSRGDSYTVNVNNMTAIAF